MLLEKLKKNLFNIKTPSLKGIITFPKFDNIEDWLVFVFTANQFSGDLIDSDEGNLKSGLMIQIYLI